ncbi:MAG: M20/M25/M40 family metallo-hydrolase [Planctomycetes bacterium]|nr:M20/M25/M40 family metallo-hydrolase [Planctomycetota bacterium]
MLPHAKETAAMRALLGLVLSVPLLAFASASAPLVAAPAPVPLVAAGVSVGDATEAPIIPPAVAEAIVEEGLHASEVMQTLDDLVNGIGPRLTGSPKCDEATLWAVERFHDLGLEAHRETWGDFAVGFERGPSHGAVVSPGHEELEFITRAWTAGTDGPRRGPALLAPDDLEELAAREASLHGAWVLLRTPDAGRRFDSSLIEERDAVFERAGIAGTVRRSSLGDRLRMSGSPRVEWDDLPTDVGVTLTADAFDALVTRLEAGEAIELEFDVDNRFLEGPVPQYNVIADLRGSTRPDEYVVVGGHIDSWDAATGTTDNGTGVATTLEAARLLVDAGARPERTIRFMLWTGEEQGLFGSRGYVEAHPDEMPRISAVFVHDEGTNPLTGLGVTAAMEPQFRRALAPLFDFVSTHEDEASPFELHVVPGLTSGSSDQDSFLAAGVPGFFWDQQGRSVYDVAWHTQKDTFDAAIPEYERHSSVVVALAALGVANLPDPISRRGMTRNPRRMGVFLAEDGVTVSRVAGRGQAHELGMQDGDRIVRVNETDVAAGELLAARDAGEGRKVLTWMRGDEPMSAVFEWDEDEFDRDPEPVVFETSDGVTIHGDYYMGRPGAPAAGSALVLLHMNRSDRHAWMPVRAALHEAGIATLAIDMRGHGESVDAEGTLAARVEARDPTLYEAMANDAAAAVAFLEGRLYAPERIGLMGASVGCSVALRSARFDPRLAGAALLTPGAAYLGVDSLSDMAQWDGRPLLMLSSVAEAERGASALGQAWEKRVAASNARLRQGVVIELVDGDDIHGTHMFGKVPDVEQRLAAFWTDVLRAPEPPPEEATPAASDAAVPERPRGRAPRDDG